MKFVMNPDDLMEFCNATGCGILEASRLLNKMRASLRKRVLLAAKMLNPDERILRDPIEADPRFGKLVREAATRAQESIKGEGMGTCHRIWAEQARILKDEHGIDWYSPAQMNPWILYD